METDCYVPMFITPEIESAVEYLQFTTPCETGSHIVGVVDDVVEYQQLADGMPFNGSLNAATFPGRENTIW